MADPVHGMVILRIHPPLIHQLAGAEYGQHGRTETWYFDRSIR